MSTPRPGYAMSRRGLLSATGAIALGAMVSACGGGSGESSKSDGGWSFTDDRKKKVTTKDTPSRIVAFTGAAAALVDFGVDTQIIGVFGETKRADGSKDPQAGDLDIDKVTIVGNAWGEFDLTAYAKLNPDLLVTHMFDPGELWYVPEESKDEILDLAPSVAITTARVPLPKPIERYAKLAEALGADLSSKQVTDAKQRFDDASETLRKAAKANPDITVMAASGSPDLFYVSNPEVSSDLRYFAELGVNLVKPDKTDEGGYFESLSWENADKYHADLIILDNRSTALQAKQLAAKPTWNALPAVKAKQVAEWDAVPRYSYAGSAKLLTDLADAISNTKKLN